MRQRTLAGTVELTGVGLHTGASVRVVLAPGDSGTGILFRRGDLPGRPVIPASVELVSDTRRGTSLKANGVEVHTVEHVLSALAGLGVHNAVVELHGPEVPILDGSALPFAEAILQSGIQEMDTDVAPVPPFTPAVLSRGKASLSLQPGDGLRITCLSSDDRGYHTQELTLDITPEVYLREIAPARTFTFYEDIEPLLAVGKIKGGSLDCAIVIRDGKPEAKGGLRFADELVRHKILDVIGDLALCRRPLAGHLVAVRPGHTLNTQFAKELMNQNEPQKPSGLQLLGTAESLDIRQILEFLPHRYPFVMVDRVLRFVGEDTLVARKCVTINEPYFVGHFPNQPVMPGVLQVEAMAQAAGILLMRKIAMESSLAYFMSADKVKFRKAIGPGDVVDIEVKLTKVKGKIGVAEGTCSVDGQVCSSAEMMFMIVPDKK
jgi:UDP-3-O-[3-hydroxymyristoyl] N-acetylglucosamine deacetylase/3-hydroxyacyl-[acyl-carrier-protein] dehydratase